MAIGEEFAAVLAAAQAGGEWAFAHLYRDLNPRLLRYFHAHAPGAADDIASETWIGVARNLPSFSGTEDAFHAWVFTIGHRQLVQHWRRQGRRPSQPVAPETLVDIVASDNPEAESVAGLTAAEAAMAIRAALSPDQAEIILLRVLGGLSVEQVASALGKRAATVRVLQHRGLRRLGEKFPPDAVTP